MSFEARVLAFAGRFLSERTFHLIVLPALADLQFEEQDGSCIRKAGRLAVLRAIAGGIRDDLARDSVCFLTLMFVPACYYVFALILCFDVLKIPLSTGFLVAATLIVILSIGQVLVCFWPERGTRASVD
jgi:hypothetical protein